MVDSILPIEEQLRRFREGLPEVGALAGGLPSRDSLVKAIAEGVARNDASALRRLTLSRGEFAWLVYPTSVYSRPPLRQAPEIAWLLHSAASERGLGRLLERLGGRELALAGYRCAADSVRQGANRIVSGCIVLRRGEGGAIREQRLFGTLVERGGRWKVLSWANAF